MEFWRKIMLPVPARKPESSPPVSPEARLERYKRGWAAVQVSSLFTRFLRYRNHGQRYAIPTQFNTRVPFNNNYSNTFVIKLVCSVIDRLQNSV